MKCRSYEGYVVYRVDTCVLSHEWTDGGDSRVSYVVRGGASIKMHTGTVEKTIRDLKDANDEEYTSWVHTNTQFKDLKGYNPYISVIQFRVRDSY